MNKNHAYTKDIVCKVWERIKVYAIREGYQIWKNINCQEENNNNKMALALSAAHQSKDAIRGQSEHDSVPNDNRDKNTVGFISLV